MHGDRRSSRPMDTPCRTSSALRNEWLDFSKSRRSSKSRWEQAGGECAAKSVASSMSKGRSAIDDLAYQARIAFTQRRQDRDLSCGMAQIRRHDGICKRIPGFGVTALQVSPRQDRRRRVSPLLHEETTIMNDNTPARSLGGGRLGSMREWDPAWAQAAEGVTSNPGNTMFCRAKPWSWSDWPSTQPVRTSIPKVLDGASAPRSRQAPAARDLDGAQDGSFLGIHTCSLGAPILLEEAKAADVRPKERSKPVTPVWTKCAQAALERSMDAVSTSTPLDRTVHDGGHSDYGGNGLSPKLAELLSAFDASYTHMYAPGTRRHIKAALKFGATMEEIMEVLKICVIQGYRRATSGYRSLAEELAAPRAMTPEQSGKQATQLFRESSASRKSSSTRSKNGSYVPLPWVIFGLSRCHESILRAEQHQNYRLQGFAIVNAR